MTMSPHTVAVPLVAGASQIVLAAGPGRYKGIVVRETSAAALVLRLWDNASAAAGTIIDIVSVAANGVADIKFDDGGIALTNGLFVERVSGTNYEGSVRLG